MGHTHTANIDTTEVGWYTTSYGDNVFLTPDTVSAQFDWQKRNPKSVMLVFDPFRTILEGTCSTRPLALHAYRLTPEFFALYKKGSFTVDSIRAAGVSYKNIFQEVPISLRPAFPSAVGAVLQRVAAEPALGTDRTVLDTTISPVVERSIAFLINKFDQMENQQGRFANYQRIMTAQLRHLVCSTHPLFPFPPPLVLPPSLLLQVQGGGGGRTTAMHTFSHFLSHRAPQKNNQERRQTLQEPSGLDNMLLTAQMESLCDQATEAAADSTARLYFVHDLLRK